MERNECAEILTKLANTKINSIMKNMTKTPTKRQLIEHFVSIKVTNDQLKSAISILQLKISNDRILHLDNQSDIDYLHMMEEIQEQYRMY